MTDVSFKISKAKAKLILEQPFFGSILCKLPIIENNFLPTMATDGTKFFYNSKFVERITFDELVFALCHEVLHVALAHTIRINGRNRLKWNYATDYVINDVLVRERIGQMPRGCLLDSQLVQKGKGHAEGVYDLLPDDPSNDGTSWGRPGTAPFDELLDGCQSESERNALEAKIKVMVAQAAQAARMQGKLTANMARFVDAAMKPKVDWRDVLRRFVSARAKVEATFARPKRRFLAVDPDLYLPALAGESMGEVVVAIDCSGSIGQDELNQFASEINAIKQDVRPSKLHVIYFDHDVCHYDVFEQDDELQVSPHGGGGTAFSPIFRFIQEKGIEPECFVCLTDLYCSDFGAPPGFPVLWVTTAATRAPWGEVVEMHPKFM